MFTYEDKEFEGSKFILRSDGSSIPLDPANRDYAEYLRYTAWVEAGNNPEDFWSQSEDFLDTSVSEVSEPKEEKETPQETEGES